MTSTRYYLARFAQAFGYLRRNQRMADAASEMHLLREAETELGRAVWEKVEGVEALTVEYWNLRKFIKERDEARRKLGECLARLDHAHEERANLLNSTPEHHQELFDERAALLVKLEQLAQRRDGVVTEAREVRRAYDGLKMKLEVLGNEAADQARVDEVKARLITLRDRFAILKQQHAEIGSQIEQGDALVDQVEAKLNEKRVTRRAHASEAFVVIGEGNREVSALKAEESLLENRMRQLYSEIGRYVSRHAQIDPNCAVAVAKHRGLVDVMRALRLSIMLNHRLAGTA